MGLVYALVKKRHFLKARGCCRSLVKIEALLGGFSVGVDDDAAVAQVLVERDFRDVQTLGNLVDAERLLAVKGLGHDGRALGLFAEAPAAPPTRPQARAEASPAWVRSRMSSRSNSASEANKLNMSRP
jgi:hypothetical protein